MSRLRPGPYGHRLEGVMQAAALIIAFAGAAGSAGLTIFHGRHNPSILLMGMFAVWVLSPFIALVVSILNSKTWAFPTRVMLWGLTLTISIGSLAIYTSVVLGPPRSQPASFFLVTPFLSLLLAAILLPLTAWLSRRR